MRLYPGDAGEGTQSEILSLDAKLTFLNTGRPLYSSNSSILWKLRKLITNIHLIRTAQEVSAVDGAIDRASGERSSGLHGGRSYYGAPPT